MGIFNFLGRSKKETELAEVLKNLTPEQIQQALVQRLGGGLVVPDDNTQGYIKSGYEANNVVYNAVTYISRRARSIPIYAAKMNKDGEYEYMTDHWLTKLLQNPNELLSGSEFLEQSMLFYLITGNSYTYKMMSSVRENDTKPIELWPLPSQYIDIKLGSSEYMPVIQSYSLNTLGDVEFPANQVIHWRTANLNYNNGEWLYGQSPLKAGLKTLNANSSGQEALAKLQQNLGAVGLMSKESGGKVDQGQVRSMQAWVNKNIQGSENKGLIRVLSQAYKYQKIGANAEELEIIKANQMTARDIYALYGLDSKLFNDPEATTYNNMSEARKASYTEAIIPALQSWSDKLGSDLLKNEPGVKLKLDLSGVEVLRKDLSEIISSLKDAYWIPTSVKQEMSGVDPDGELPEYVLPNLGLGNMPIDAENKSRLNDLLKKYNENY